jgi:chromosome segregation ATPase
LTRQNIHDLVNDRKRLEEAIHDTQRIIDAIGSAVDRVEDARQHISVLGDELRNQTTITKARLAWLITEVDRIRKEMEAIQREQG